jgi:hypothetical protein
MAIISQWYKDYHGNPQVLPPKTGLGLKTLPIPKPRYSLPFLLTTYSFNKYL